MDPLPPADFHWLSARRDSVPYTSCFCEENVLQLARWSLPSAMTDGVRVYCVFISNRAKKTPLWRQRLAGEEDGYVLWDYHVVLCTRSVNNNNSSEHDLVFDADTTLPYPCPLVKYIEETLWVEKNLPKEFRQKVRIVEASQCLRYFASDRSHMLSSGMPFPDWPALRGPDAETAMNLDVYWDMERETDSEIYGKVLTAKEFLQWAHSPIQS